MSLFVVVGTTGEYSDRSEWIVAAYWDQEKALEHAARARRRTAEIAASYGINYLDLLKAKDTKDPAVTNVWDPNWSHDYTGTDYTVAEVPLLEAVPE